MKNLIKIISGLIIIVLILLGYLLFQELDKNLQVIFFDVGQGDAILIKTPNNQKILIDGGPDNIIVNKIGRYFNFFDKTIDLMILTHAHSDHLVGLVEVLKRYQVKKVLYNGAVHTTPEYFEWLRLIKEKKISLEIAKTGQEFIFSSDLKLKIIYPLENLTNKQFEDLNQTSIVSLLTFKNTNFLFMGDLPQAEEEEMLKSYPDLKAEIIKIGHHGSKYSTSDELLRAVDPKVAIIQVGKDNKFGLPALITLKKLERKNINILRTDQQGDIIIKSNNKRSWVVVGTPIMASLPPP